VILETRAVTARYRGAERPALDRVSCAVAEAQLVAVLVQGRPVGEWRRSALARVLGVVSQREEVVFPLRVDETVMLGRYARLGALAAPSAGDRAAVQAALERCDIAHLVDRSVDSLSGGEWQRVRIARALVGEPRALVLDEPTASLDVRHEMELFELIRQLVAGGLAGLVITHHLNLAARFADRMVLLNGGAVVAEGTPQEVLQRETLSRVFEWPVAVTTWCDGSPQVVPLRPGESGP
jgi:iron complex transport system ATP-binding protein